MMDTARPGSIARRDIRRDLAGWVSIFFLSGLYLISYVDRLVLVVLVQPLKAELGLSDTQIGLLIGTSFAFFYSAVAIPISRYADRANRRNLLFAGTVLWNVTTLLSAFAHDFTTLLLLRIGVAVGEAVLVPAAMSMIGDLFPRERRMLPTSIFVGVGASGASAALVIAAAGLDFASSGWLRGLPVVGELTVWRLTLFLIGSFGLLFSLVFRLCVREPARARARAGGGRPEGRPPGFILHLQRHWLTYFGFMTGTAMIAMVNISYKTWYPTILSRQFGMSPADAGYVFGTIGVCVAILGALIVPNVAGKLYRGGRDDAVIWIGIGSTTLAMPLLVASLMTSVPWVSLALTVPAFFIQLGTGIMMTTTLSVLPPPDFRARVTAIYLLVTNILGLGLGPVLAAVLSDQLFGGDHGLSLGLITLIGILMPIEFLLFLASRRAFVRTIRESAALDVREGEGEGQA